MKTEYREEVERMDKEITSLKNQIRTLRVFYLVGIIIFFSAIINFQVQYSEIRSYYQSSVYTNQEILRNLENLNPELEEILSNLQ